MNTDSRNPFRSTHRFTLVEMLVVIAIIAVLAALLLPSLQGALRSGRQVHCAGNLRCTGIAMAQYISDSNSFIPKATWLDTNARGSGNSWDWVLLGYLSNDYGIFRCPEDKARRPFFAQTPQSYLPNHPQEYMKKSLDYPDLPMGKRATRIRNIGNLILVVCGNWMFDYPSAASYLGASYVGYNMPNCVSYNYTHYIPFGTQAEYYTLGHNFGTLFLNGDGSVVHLQPQEFCGFYNFPTGSKPSIGRWLINR